MSEISEENKTKKLKSLLGFAQKSGKLISGEESILKAIKSNKVKLLLIASDSSENTKETYFNQVVYYNVPCKETVLTKEEIGSSIGKVQRSAVAIADEGFTKAILNLV
ncbi:ribosomal L7Ae/L30e/S12e/Gadd45 family protein [Selenomonadales bacterium OttesenSCG-928-I06]|nr:ribosomal L7Ae/L30e/S12e/Gadd45 family protein [Selenomonadales bacterium OttesenSCG-928-I06]